MPKSKRTPAKKNGKAAENWPASVVGCVPPAESRRTIRHVQQALVTAVQDRVGSPLMRDAAKILGAVLTALYANDKTTLRAGTKWARTVRPGGRAPLSELVRDLYDIVRDSRNLQITRGVRAASSLSGMGFVKTEDVPRIAHVIDEALLRAADVGKDDELKVKTILRAAGWSEAAANNAVHGARLT